MPATYDFHRETTHYCRPALILALLLLSKLHLQAYSIPALQIVEGQNLNLAVAVERAPAAGMQLPSEQFSGPALPIAPPTPAMDAKVYFDSGVTSLGKLDYNKAIIEFTKAIRLDPILYPPISVAGTPIVIKETSMRLSAITARLSDSTQIMPLPTIIVEPSISIKAN